MRVAFRLWRCCADTMAHYVALLMRAGAVISMRLCYREPAVREQASGEPS